MVSQIKRVASPCIILDAPVLQNSGRQGCGHNHSTCSDTWHLSGFGTLHNLHARHQSETISTRELAVSSDTATEARYSN